MSAPASLCMASRTRRAALLSSTPSTASREKPPNERAVGEHAFHSAPILASTCVRRGGSEQ